MGNVPKNPVEALRYALNNIHDINKFREMGNGKIYAFSHTYGQICVGSPERVAETNLFNLLTEEKWSGTFEARTKETSIGIYADTRSKRENGKVSKRTRSKTRD